MTDQDFAKLVGRVEKIEHALRGLARSPWLPAEVGAILRDFAPTAADYEAETAA
jgi:hypothetical protein